MSEIKIMYTESEHAQLRLQHAKKNNAICKAIANGIAGRYILSDDKSFDGLINIYCDICEKPLKFDDFKRVMHLLWPSINEMFNSLPIKDEVLQSSDVQHVRDLLIHDTMSFWKTYLKTVNRTIGRNLISTDPFDNLIRLSNANNATRLRDWIEDLVDETEEILNNLRDLVLYPGLWKKPRSLDGKKLKGITPEEAKRTMMPISINIAAMVAVQLLHQNPANFDWVQCYADALRTAANEQDTYNYAVQTLLQEAILSTAKYSAEVRVDVYANINFDMFTDALGDVLKQMRDADKMIMGFSLGSIIINDDLVGFIGSRIDGAPRDMPRDVIITQAISEFAKDSSVIKGYAEILKDSYRTMAMQIIQTNYPGEPHDLVTKGQVDQDLVEPTTDDENNPDKEF